ncbi:autotransporter assembly complex family protein [Bradyrhizobium sp. LHD-71]|uniref:autotransporter assembly complex protein TamA n=1 Tax=Bradyrhizobium sp. LHD-71 TaxID=3072141 RepID=UPI00280D5C5F|nr:autotransporter assembly complex family protein [Bradyrhizobium sp. LHD-71]MDQ8728414.1 autotransporter assembly complex family protein [Bradyrhizobium sp. LHD-71]
MAAPARRSRVANLSVAAKAGARIVAALVLACSHAHADESSFLDRVTGWFNPDRTPGEPSTPETTPYKITFDVAGGERSIRSAITDASNLESLKRQAPGSVAGLMRRAVVDRDRIVAALYAEGRYGGTVTIKVAGHSPDDPAAFDAVNVARQAGPVPVTVAVDPGPVFKFGSVRVLDAAGRWPVPEAPRPTQMRLVTGEIARASDIAGAERVIVKALRDRGKPFAHIAAKDVVADHATKTLNVTFLVHEGPVATFGTFTVSGAQRLKPGFIEERVGIRPGEPYSPERLAKLRKRLSEYEGIASVRIRQADALDTNGQLPIYIDVTERDPRYFGGGAKYSSTEGSVVNAYWGHRNLFGGGETLRLDAQVSWFGRTPDAVPDANPFGYRAAATFLKPGIFTPADDLIVQTAVLREVTDAYVRDAVTFLGGVRHRFSDQLSVQVGLDLEQSHLQDWSGSNDYFIAGIPVDVAYDTTDSPFDPSRGIRLNATIEPFAYLGNSGAGPLMMKAAFSAYHAFDEDKRYILAGRVAAGSIVGADLLDIPPQRRFYVGGGGSLRGFNYQSASPRDAFGRIIGGMSFVSASAEMRVKVTDTIGIVPFVDAGAAFASEVPDFDGLRYSAGIGLRYYTALGPIRLDFAVPLNRQKDDARYGIYVSLGQAF